MDSSGLEVLKGSMRRLLAEAGPQLNPSRSAGRPPVTRALPGRQERQTFLAPVETAGRPPTALSLRKKMTRGQASGAVTQVETRELESGARVLRGRSWKPQSLGNRPRSGDVLAAATSQYLRGVREHLHHLARWE